MEIERKTISVEEAAYFIKIDPNRLRNLIKNGVYDFGYFIQGKIRKSYKIYPEQFFKRYQIGWEDIFNYRRAKKAAKNKSLQKVSYLFQNKKVL